MKKNPPLLKAGLGLTFTCRTGDGARAGEGDAINYDGVRGEVDQRHGCKAKP